MFNSFISIAIIVLSLGFGFLYVKPQYDTTVSRRADLVTLDETLKSTSQIQSLITQTENTLDTIDPAALQRFSVFLPTTADSILLANNIQHIGQTHGIVLDKIKTSDQLKSQGATGAKAAASDVIAAASAKKYATIKTEFSFTTTDDSFRAFLGDLEKNLGLMNVTSLSFTPAPDGVGSLKVKGSATPEYLYTIAIETYSLK